MKTVFLSCKKQMIFQIMLMVIFFSDNFEKKIKKKVKKSSIKKKIKKVLHVFGFIRSRRLSVSCLNI